jgi:hypothetical protein
VQKQKIVLVAAENMASCLITRTVIRELKDSIELVMLVPNMPVDKKANQKRALKLLKKSSLGYFVFKFVEIYIHHLFAIIKRLRVKDTCRRHSVPFKN